MAAMTSGIKVKISSLRLSCAGLLFSAITCAAFLRAASSAEAHGVKFQPRLNSDNESSQCLQLHEEGKLVWGNLPVDIRGGGPQEGPCRLHRFIYEHMEGEKGQYFVTSEMRAANKTNNDTVVVQLNGHPAEIRTVTSAEARKMCRGAQKFTDAPIVFVRRDNPNIFHLFERELLPLYISLRHYHMQHFRFQVIFTREWQPEGKPEHLQQNQTRLLDIFRTVSGGVKPLSLSSMEAHTLCGHTAIIGMEGGRLFKFGYDHREDYMDRYPESRDVFGEFLQWFLAAYGLMKPEALQELHVPTVLLVERGEDEHRRIRGAENFEDYARSQSWHVRRLNCRVAGMEEQLKALLKASLLVTVHGAAMAMAGFLPPRAVAVEMMPFGFTTDFYHGYANWLDMASVSHVVWHEEDSMQHIEMIGMDVAGVSQPCGKNADVFVTKADAAKMLQAAYLIWRTPLRHREQTTYLNRPAVQQCSK